MVAANPRRKPFAHRITRVVNPLVLRIARFIPFYCVLEHQGRRSGRVYRTPLAVVRTKDGFLLPLAYDADPQWAANIRHAGGATVEWLGRRYPISDPVPVAKAAAQGELKPVVRLFLPVFGVKNFLRVKAG